MILRIGLGLALALAVFAMPAVGPMMSPAHAASSAGMTLKHKIAVSRFTNETNYGKGLLTDYTRDDNADPLGKQASDILSAYLAQTERFIVLERYDLKKIREEQELAGIQTQAVGADTLIVGSIVEYGRAVDGTRGFATKRKRQRVHAKVAIRLVDVRTGQVIYSATGAGEATTESKTTLGLGSRAGYDASLSDKAISAAIEDVIEELINTAINRPWTSDILDVQGQTVYISGGAHQGLRPGMRLAVMNKGKTIKSAQTGFPITLPASKVGEIEIQSTFGETETNEGSVATMVAGGLPSDTSNLFVSKE